MMRSVRGRPDVCRVLVEHRADPLAADREGCSPLLEAAHVTPLTEALCTARSRLFRLPSLSLCESHGTAEDG